MGTRENRAPARRVFVVAFDITDDRRRRRFVKRLGGWGLRTQFSVFECLVALNDLARFEHELRTSIDPVLDRLTLYEMCGACVPNIRRHGEPYGALNLMDGLETGVVTV
jgi:CRISPR-associated protein Cas2